MNGLNAAKPRRNGACAIGRKDAALQNLYRCSRVSASEERRQDRAQKPRFRMETRLLHGFCRGRGAGMRLFEGIYADFARFAEYCARHSSPFPVYRRFRRSDGAAAGTAARVYRPSAPRPSVPYLSNCCLSAGVRPFVRAFFCVSPCHAAQSMV